MLDYRSTGRQTRASSPPRLQRITSPSPTSCDGPATKWSPGRAGVRWSVTGAAPGSATCAVRVRDVEGDGEGRAVAAGIVHREQAARRSAWRRRRLADRAARRRGDDGRAAKARKRRVIVGAALERDDDRRIGQGGGAELLFADDRLPERIVGADGDLRLRLAGLVADRRADAGIGLGEGAGAEPDRDSRPRLEARAHGRQRDLDLLRFLSGRRPRARSARRPGRRRPG